MKYTTIEQINDMDDGDIISAFKGRVAKVEKMVEARDQSWNFQKLLVEQGGDEIIVQVWNQDEIDRSKAKGEWYFFHSAKGKKGDVEGVKADTYKGERYIAVNKPAKFGRVVEEEEEDLEDDLPYGRDVDDEPAKEREAQKKRLADKHKAINPTLAAKEFLARAGNAMNLCLRTARAVCEKDERENKKVKGQGFFITPEQFQAITSSLFIAMDKHGLIENMPWQELPADKATAEGKVNEDDPDWDGDEKPEDKGKEVTP